MIDSAVPSPAPAVSSARAGGPIEMWGGVECTVNRVHDRWLDQMARSGHAHRPSDLDLFAGLGIRAIRYPVLWEQFAPDGFEHIDWTWADERLGRLRELGIRPIVGLVHHGSGPRYTSLLDPAFPDKLEQFAGLVAERYPWVDAYTPVNEPLTTARFSALYGLWYPHTRNLSSFVRALHHQCRAVVLAMRAVRRVNPAAQLIQTEDLGRVYSTPALAYEADFENERRWLSLDLLCGRLGPAHPLWKRVQDWGLTAAELDEYLKAPCPPDIVGINHYLSSDRFLDERTERYPGRHVGGNDRDRYVDVEAVRVIDDHRFGVKARLRETWERYGLPIAITESHLGCTREEQLRWLHEAWQDSHALRTEGVDMRAVTAWSLLGAFDWNQLVTCDSGFYEPGVFDVRGPRPRPTALAALVRTLARGRAPTHPVLAQPGWWHREDRFFYPVAEGRSYVAAYPGPGREDMHDRADRPLAIVGATGLLGRAFARLCDVRGISYHALTRGEIDLADSGSIDAALERLQPWAVINCAGVSRERDAERAPDVCQRANVAGPVRLAASCARHGTELMVFSSDRVFDGRKGAPYLESDAPAPVGVLGRSQAEMEARVREILPAALVVRTSALFSPWSDRDFVAVLLARLAASRAAGGHDPLVSPTYVLDLVHAALDLLIDGEPGIRHLVNAGPLPQAAFVAAAARAARLDPAAQPRLVAGVDAELHAYAALATERGQLLPALHEALPRWARHRALECEACAPGGVERRRAFRPWRYRQTGVWA